MLPNAVNAEADMHHDEVRKHHISKNDKPFQILLQQMTSCRWAATQACKW